MRWDVLYHVKFVAEFHQFTPSVQDEIVVLTELLRAAGPALKRPHADTLKGSRFVNMKELRFDADDGVWRLAYAFDPRRRAILLVAGDKSGVSGKQFYKRLITQVDERFAAYLDELKRS